jgi:hypothetical protein
MTVATTNSNPATDASQILAEADRDTHRPLVAWAAGVISACAMDLIRYATSRDPRHLVDTGYFGGSLERGRWYDGDRKGLSVRGDGSPVVSVTWAEVAAVLDPLLARPAVLDECRRVLRARSAAQLFSTEFYEADEAMRTAALAVWAACRPADVQQLDLFEVAARPATDSRRPSHQPPEEPADERAGRTVDPALPAVVAEERLPHPNPHDCAYCTTNRATLLLTLITGGQVTVCRPHATRYPR